MGVEAMDPLGPFLSLDPDQAVDVEAGFPPGENPLGPFGSQVPPGDQESNDLAGERLGRPGAVDLEDPMGISVFGLRIFS